MIIELENEKYQDRFCLDFANTYVPLLLYIQYKYAPILTAEEIIGNCMEYMYPDDYKWERMEKYMNLFERKQTAWDGGSCVLLSSVMCNFDANFSVKLKGDIMRDVYGIMNFIRHKRMLGMQYLIQCVCAEKRCARVEFESREVVQRSIESFSSNPGGLLDMVAEKMSQEETVGDYLSFLNGDIYKMVYDYELSKEVIGSIDLFFRNYCEGNELFKSVEVAELSSELRK